MQTYKQDIRDTGYTPINRISVIQVTNPYSGYQGYWIQTYNQDIRDTGYKPINRISGIQVTNL